MAKKLSEFSLNHLEFNIEDRGKWRKYNPYNPQNDDEKETRADLKVESLDDLFDDVVEDNKNDNADNSIQNDIEKPNNEIENKSNQIDEPEDIQPYSITEDRNEDDIMSVDIQKQLEAKFDELFGDFDEE